MSTKHYFFDFDETLIDTSKLWPFRQTNEGRSFVSTNPNRVETKLTDDRLVPLVNNLAASNQISITTNSPKAYTTALLKKHGFFETIPIYWNLHKPCHEELVCAIDGTCTSRTDALAIGDSASDILAAHGCSIPSIAVSWGKTCNIQQLNRAEPNKIVKNFDELEQILTEFENGDHAFQPRAAPSKYIYLEPALYECHENPNIEIVELGPYYPTGHGLFYHSQSNEILRFKDMKYFSLEEIKQRTCYSFFHGGMIKTRFVFLDLFKQFYNQLKIKIDSLELDGSSYMIAAPNSAPEYCYKTDINQLMTNNINHFFFGFAKEYLKRGIFRIFPKKKSHAGGGREEKEHFKTIGIKDKKFLPDNLDNLIIFDDITTTNSQLISIAIMIREIIGFGGNIYGVVLGQTEY